MANRALPEDELPAGADEQTVLPTRATRGDEAARDTFVTPVAQASDGAQTPNEVDAFIESAIAGPAAPAPVKKSRKRRGFVDVLLLVLALAMIGGGVFIGVQSWRTSHGPGTFVDMVGNRVQADDPEVADPTFVAAADAKPQVDGLRMIITSVGMNVPLGEVNEVNGVMNPPGFTSAYRVRNVGVTLDKASTGTVYVVAHSLRAPGHAPGNFVIDIPTNQILVQTGAIIQVGDLNYQVDSTAIVNKLDLASHAELWANTPGMLVFITCMQYDDSSMYKDTGGHSPNNVVVIGHLVS